VRRRALLALLMATVAGVLLITVGIVYLTVPCEDLPGVLGPHAGDSSPRTALGVISLVLGALALGIAWIVNARRPPKAPLHS
jgi:hypothetical protein